MTILFGCKTKIAGEKQREDNDGLDFKIDRISLFVRVLSKNPSCVITRI